MHILYWNRAKYKCVINYGTEYAVAVLTENAKAGKILYTGFTKIEDAVRHIEDEPKLTGMEIIKNQLQIEEATKQKIREKEWNEYFKWKYEVIAKRNKTVKAK